MFSTFQKSDYNRKNNRKKMGCQTSKQQNHDIISLQTQQQFQISYRQLVTQDRGHIFELYHFSTILNRSNYSIVRKVISRASLQARICKIVPLLDKKYFTAVAEVEFLKKLDHPNITQIFEYFLEPSFLYIVMEQVPGDRILRQLHKIKDGILFNDIVEIMKQLLLAVDFFHRKMIAHRTLTTENILLFYKQSQPCIKIIDFSQACTIGSTNMSSIPAEKRNIVLSENEALETDKIDIYDCGIVFFALLRGRRIKENHVEVNYREMLENVGKVVKMANFCKKVEKDLGDLLARMLAQNPKERPSAQQCLNHEFFTNFSKKVSSKKAIESLVQFQADDNLKYLLSMYASINMTSAIEKAQHLSEFYNLDTNKDGQIQLQQLVLGIQNTFNVDEQKARIYAEQVFAKLDKNKSGSINFSQYIIGTVQLSKLVSNSFLERMFNEIDINRDGYISEEEFNELIYGIDRYNVLEGQKEVDFGTFRKIMMKIIDKQSVRALAN